MTKRYEPTIDSSECYEGMQECVDGDWVSIDDHKAEVKRLEADYNQLRQAFFHIHIKDGVTDVCEKCGLDLRNPIHYQKGD